MDDSAEGSGVCGGHNNAVAPCNTKPFRPFSHKQFFTSDAVDETMPLLLVRVTLNLILTLVIVVV